MINKWLITGDTHGNFTRLSMLSNDIQKDKNTAIIILGDAGINITLNENDNHLKNYLSKKYNFRIYCVRGNHEVRPQNVPAMKTVYDDDVKNVVYMQPKWPNIRYFMDYSTYWINNYRTLVIGGAYSVDKPWRLRQGWFWVENEQLSIKEMNECEQYIKSGPTDYDLVLTHTCPLNFQPIDLFLPGLDQSTVDNSMEVFLEKVRNMISYNVWLFGHYHADRLVRPHVEMLYHDIEYLNDIFKRWNQYDKDKTLDWWLQKGPDFND